MNWLISKLKELLLFIIILSILMVIYTTFIMINLIPNEQTLNRTILFILGMLIFFILGIISGNKEKKNGWLSGLSSSLLIILLSIIIGLFTKTNITIFLIGKYVCYMFCSIIGGILGVNLSFKKKRVK